MSGPTAEQERVARAALAEAARILGITRPPPIAWLDTPEFLGNYSAPLNLRRDETIADVDLIELNPACPVDRLRSVVFHEARHCWQLRTVQHVSNPDSEADAERFALEHTGHRGGDVPAWLARLTPIQLR